MKPIIQKLPLGKDCSFVARTYRTPVFEVGWHQHVEYELILFTEGSGLSFVGNHVGEFETNEVYFLGSNLPHTFQKHSPDLITSAIVVQFKEDLLGKDFIHLPESRSISALFGAASLGLKMNDQLRQELGPMIRELEHATGFKRILLLAECLHLMAEQGSITPLSTQETKIYNARDAAVIDKIFQFTIDSFKGSVSLGQVAAVACMSIPAFCNYFKKSTKKTYIDFLNEVRIGYACTQLLETDKPVLDICYGSGYNTMANFHKQFLRIRKITPLQYRKRFISASVVHGDQ